MQLYQSIIFHPSRPCQTKNYPTVSASLSHFLSVTPFHYAPFILSSFNSTSSRTTHTHTPHLSDHLLPFSLPVFTFYLTPTIHFFPNCNISLFVTLPQLPPRLTSPPLIISYPTPTTHSSPHLTSLHFLNLTPTFHFLPHLSSPPSIWGYDSDKSKSDNKRQTEKHYTQKHGSCSLRIRI